MPRNTYLVIGIVIVLVVAGFIFLKQRGGNEALAPTGEQQTETQAGAPTSAGTQVPGETGISGQAGTEVKGVAVTYTDNGFSPATVTINKGETVAFKNNSSRDFWPASAIHPSHAVYPEKGGCIGSKFDACKGISSGGSWSFTFNSAGTWKYHDHLKADFTGTITVQ